MIRDLGMYGILAFNWGLPHLKVGEDAQYSSTTVEQRRAQAVYYFLDLMNERGVDVVADVRAWVDTVKAEFKEREKREFGEQEFIDWLREHNEWAYFIYAYDTGIIKQSGLSEPGEVQYDAVFRAQFLKEIREIAARRRQLVTEAAIEGRERLD